MIPELLSPTATRIVQAGQKRPLSRSDLARLRYGSIAKRFLAQLERGQVSQDTRSGHPVNSVNVLIIGAQFPPSVKAAIEKIQRELLAIEPDLLLTKPHEWHIAVFTLSPSYWKQLKDPKPQNAKEIYEGPNFYDQQPQAYDQVLRQQLQVPPFVVELRGIIATGEAIIGCGYDGVLNPLRCQLVTAFGQAGLRVVDAVPNISHLTMARYKTGQLKDPARFVAALKRFSNVPIGCVEVNQLYLVREQRTFLSEMEVLGTYHR